MDPRLTGLDLKTFLLSASDLLMPRVCICCGRQLLAGERHLCSTCLADLPLTLYENMVHNPMADKFNAAVEAQGYERAAALFYYSGDYKKITQALKYNRNFGAGRFFARMLGERLAAAGFKADLVCPVPLHWARRFRRGYNQAEVIGREVARALGAGYATALLRRCRRTDSQTALSAEERARNTAGAFAVRGWGVRKAGTPESILLIDDVFTTGATVAACAAALRAAYGPQVRISVATLAFAGE